MGRCILHGRVRANRSLWRVRNRLHAGSGRFPCPVRRPETPSASACSTQGGDTAGITHGAATLGSRTGVRPVTAYHGRSSNPMRGMPDQRRTGMQARRSSPTQQWEESPWSPRATIAQSAGVTAETADPRVVGTVSGIRPKTVAPVESCSEASGYSRRIAVRHGGPGRGRSVCPSYLRGGRASPPHHDRQPWCDAGPGAPGPPRTIRMDGGTRRFGDARPTARWCNGSTPALWREVRVRIPRRAPTPIRSALRRSHKGRGVSAVERRTPHDPSFSHLLRAGA